MAHFKIARSHHSYYAGYFVFNFIYCSSTDTQQSLNKVFIFWHLSAELGGPSTDKTAAWYKLSCIISIYYLIIYGFKCPKYVYQPITVKTAYHIFFFPITQYEQNAVGWDQERKPYLLFQMVRIASFSSIGKAEEHTGIGPSNNQHKWHG